MAITFPTTLDSLGNPSSANKLGTSTPVHSQQHSDANDAIEALEAKVGVDSSAVATSLDYLIKNTTGGHTHNGTDSRLVAAATTSLRGASELATDAETYTGTDNGRTITPSNLTGAGYFTGWIPMTVTLTYSSVDDPTGVITSSADYSSVLSVGMRIKFTNNAQTVYGIITAISGTTVTFLHEIDPTDDLALNLMQNSAITNPFFSFHKTPYGFPADKRKWTIIKAFTDNGSQASPVTNTWYHPSAITISIPIGVWDVCYGAGIVQIAAGASYGAQTTLSTANNSESDSELSAAVDLTSPAGGNGQWMTAQKTITLASKTTHYLNLRSTTSTPTSLGWNGKERILIACSYI